MSDFSDALCSFIAEEVLLEKGPASVKPNTRLIDGLVDSLGIMQVIAFIRDEYEVTFDDEDLEPENFATVATIEALVAKKRAALVAAGPSEDDPS
jgi:acyl carrier protein